MSREGPRYSIPLRPKYFPALRYRETNLYFQASFGSFLSLANKRAQTNDSNDNNIDDTEHLLCAK